MKKLILLTALCLLVLSLNAQIKRPAVWSYASKKINQKEAIVYMRAEMQAGWHIYSINQADGGPDKTEIKFMPSNTYSLIKGITEPKPIVKYEDVFDMNVAFFENTATFQQRVKLLKIPVVIKGTIRFMVCTATECIPSEEIPFTITIK